jgi:hypothetical protein
MTERCVNRIYREIDRARAIARTITAQLNREGEAGVSIRTHTDRLAVTMVQRERAIVVVRLYSDDMIIRWADAAGI